MSDRLALSNAIEEAGIPRDKAQRLASVIFEAIHTSVVTKADLAALEIRLSERFTRRGIAGLILATSALFGALHIWPPHL
jgi:ethanolamine utilization protein EutP (predicted NTPase)